MSWHILNIRYISNVQHNVVKTQNETIGFNSNIFEFIFYYLDTTKCLIKGTLELILMWQISTVLRASINIRCTSNSYSKFRIKIEHNNNTLNHRNHIRP